MDMEVFSGNVSSGKQQRHAPFSWGPGIREEYVIHYVVRGKGIFQSQDKQYRLQAGQSFVIHPFRQVCYSPDPEDPWEYVWVNIDSENLVSFFKKITYLQDDCIIDFVDSEKILPFYERLSVIEKRTDTVMTRFGLGCTILGIYLDAYSAKKMFADDLLYAEVTQFIESNFQSTGCFPAMIARNINISYASLYRLFKKKDGISPSMFLQSYRIKQAENMLKLGMSIKTTAFSCGYSDQFYFSKMFKKIKGVTPSDFKKSSMVNNFGEIA